MVLLIDVTPPLGPAYTLLAFVIVITGGLGSMAGALGASVLQGNEARINRLFVIPELVGRFFFGVWAPLIAPTTGRMRWLLSRVFFFSLCSSLPLMVPAAVVALFIRLFARTWFQGKVDEATA